MSFGKRSAGDPRPTPPPGTETSNAPDADGILSVRTRVTNPGGLDKGFIALAAGVVLLSAGGALAAPSVLGMFDDGKPRPIAELVAGLDRDATRQVLATEAFPDAGGRSFLQSLEKHFPESYDRLLGQMTRTARAGGDRDALVMNLTDWGMDFGVANLDYVSRSGADGFDTFLQIATDGLDVLRQEMGDCTLGSFQQLIEQEAALQSLTRYGSRGYELSMRANAKFVELAARGRNAPRVDGKLNADDENALQSVLISFMADPQMMQIASQAMRQGPGSPAEMQQAVAKNLDMCKIGRSIIVKLERLPSGTKSRLLAAALSTDFEAIRGQMNSFGGL